MFHKILLIFVSSAAFVALEWSLPSVLSHVLLQFRGSSASEIALVTLERLFSCVLHHVNFQFRSFNARILAHCASMWLFTRVRLLVLLQVA